jgi:signal transduction histidine kinase
MLSLPARERGATCIALGVLATALLVLVLDSSDVAHAARDQKKVLVVYSTRRDTQIAVIGERDLPRLLEDGLGSKPDYYSENIDAARFADTGYGAFADYLRLKYQGTHFDLVIATQKLAVDFIASHRGDLFRDTPVVYFTEDADTWRMPDSAGVIIDVDHRQTVRLAKELQPDINQVFVVTGNSARDKTAEGRVRPQFDSMARDIHFTYLSGLPTAELMQRVAALPERSIVYYLLFYQDGAGVNVNPIDFLDQLTAAANRPVYSWVTSTLGRGVVGGSLVSIESQIAVVAGLAVRVLGGEATDKINTVTANLSVNQLDWRQLQRWHIPQDRIPAGTIVQYRELSAFERYKPYIFGGAAVVAAETLLIAGLLVQAARRRRAEERLRASETALRASYTRIRDLGARLLMAQDDERSRIARELHDDIGQQLTVLALDLALVSGRGAEPGADAAAMNAEALARARSIAKSVHDISHRLHPHKLRLLGLVSAIGSIRSELRATGIAFTFTHENVPETISHDLTLCLYRIAQEAVQNAVKHSEAQEISVRLAGDPQHLTLTIADNGVGFDVDAVQSRGLGLISMRERLEPFGGTLTISSKEGGGTRVDAVVPQSAATGATIEPRMQRPA